jgi:hypothetical protein
MQYFINTSIASTVKLILLQFVYILLSFQNISTEKSELFAILDY